MNKTGWFPEVIADSADFRSVVALMPAFSKTGVSILKIEVDVAHVHLQQIRSFVCLEFSAIQLPLVQ